MPFDYPDLTKPAYQRRVLGLDPGDPLPAIGEAELLQLVATREASAAARQLAVALEYAGWQLWELANPDQKRTRRPPFKPPRRPDAKPDDEVTP